MGLYPQKKKLIPFLSLRCQKRFSGRLVNLKIIFVCYFPDQYSSIKVELELENKLSHHAQKYKEPKKNNDIHPVDLKYE